MSLEELSSYHTPGIEDNLALALAKLLQGKMNVSS